MPAGCLAAVLVMNMMAMMPAMAEDEILAGAEVRTAEAIELMDEPEEEEAIFGPPQQHRLVQPGSPDDHIPDQVKRLSKARPREAHPHLKG